MVQRRYSRQRELIYNCLMNTKEHPTAEMVYQWLLPENPNLSRGTVYRNLKLLSEDGLLKQLHFPVERYDADTRQQDRSQADLLLLQQTLLHPISCLRLPLVHMPRQSAGQHL